MESFRQDGIGWRIDLIKRRVGEWIEYKTSQIDIDIDIEGWDFGWLKSPLLWQTIKFLMWSTVALLAVWIVWQLYLLGRTYWKRWQRAEQGYTPVAEPVAAPQFSQADWLERSQNARIEGNYRQAIFCLYQAMLAQLHERGLIQRQLSLSDEEYRRSLTKLQIAPLQPYNFLLSIHQRLCFSKAEADRSLFEECQQAYQQIQN